MLLTLILHWTLLTVTGLWTMTVWYLIPANPYVPFYPIYHTFPTLAIMVKTPSCISAGLTAPKSLSVGYYFLLADMELKRKVTTLKTSHSWTGRVKEWAGPTALGEVSRIGRWRKIKKHTNKWRLSERSNAFSTWRKGAWDWWWWFLLAHKQAVKIWLKHCRRMKWGIKTAV